MIQNKQVKEKKELLQPTNDYVFKRLFGYKGKENITKCLLELITKEKYEKVEVVSQETTEKDILNDKVGILDIKVNTEKEQFDVEMQVSNYKYMAERLLWYWAKMYSKSIKENEQYSKTKRTIAVLFLNSDIEIIKNIPKIHTIWYIKENEYSELILTNRLEIHIISLKKLREKNYQDIEDIRLINWLSFIQSPEGNDYNMESDKELKEAYEVLENISSSDRERELAEIRENTIIERNSLLGAAKEEGEEKGIEKGKIEVAKKLLKQKVDIDIIIKATGFTKEKIEKINNDNNNY